MQTKILLIEDNLSDRFLLEELLSSACPDKYQIKAVATLSEGLEQLDIGDFNIVLADLSLPDSDGSMTVTRILEHSQSIPIVVLSGQDNDDLALEIVQMGTQYYLVKGKSNDGHLIHRAIEYAIERKHQEQKLLYLANYDSLTGLVNRGLFRNRLDRAFIRANRNKSLVALFMIDLDRFKNINDTLGHDAGDELLIQVARRIKNCTRDGDTVARLGGDEFTIILEDIICAANAATVANNILNIMKSSFDLSIREVYVSPSIGISIYPTDAPEADQILKNADTAMYSAKEGGRNCYHFYIADMNEEQPSVLDMEIKLRRAIKQEDFVLYYQPKFNIATQELIGAEALIRWGHAEEDMIPPAVFIPLAEEFGLIGIITEWVIQEACNQNYMWQQEGYTPIRMAINLSPRQFNQNDMVNRIFNQIRDSKLAPEYVELEITEGALMRNAEKNNEILKELKNGGIHISIDDFGTGYSSLSYLKKFYLDTLKIDQSFVQDILDDPDSAAIVSAIIAMAKSLRLDVIAEGVETSAQMECLIEKGCSKAQGYLLGRPVPAQEFVQFFVEKSLPLQLET